jgi:hypothetical protein
MNGEAADAAAGKKIISSEEEAKARCPFHEAPFLRKNFQKMFYST